MLWVRGSVRVDAFMVTGGGACGLCLAVSLGFLAAACRSRLGMRTRSRPCPQAPLAQSWSHRNSGGTRPRWAWTTCQYPLPWAGAGPEPVRIAPCSGRRRKEGADGGESGGGGGGPSCDSLLVEEGGGCLAWMKRQNVDFKPAGWDRRTSCSTWYSLYSQSFV